MIGSRYPGAAALTLPFVLGLCLAGRPAQGDDARLRVVVRTETDPNGAFIDRVRGQTVDLPVEIVSVDGGTLHGGLDAQVEIAAALSRARAARAVVWYADDEVFLYLATPQPPHLLARRIGDGPTPPPTTASVGEPGTPTPAVARHPASGAGSGGGGTEDETRAHLSAALESAALIVRSALRAVIDGETVGVPRVEPARTAFTADVPNGPPPESAETGPLTLILLGDFRTGSDDVGSSPPRGFGAHLGVGWRRLALGAAGTTTFDRDVGTSIRQPFWRQNAALFIDADMVRGEGARLTAEVQGGVSYSNLFRRDGTVHRPNLLLGAEIRGAIDALALARLKIPVWAGVGADYIPHAPPVRQSTGGPILFSTRKFQPRVMIGTGLVF